MRLIIFFAVSLTLCACGNGYEANDTLSSDEHTETLAQLAPYLIGKSDEFSFEERFLPQNKPFYDNFIALTGARLVYFQKRDSASLFYFQYRDLTSLYEHYRGIGGYFRTDANGNVSFVNLLFHTPRLTTAEIEERRQVLFEQMRNTGNVSAYLGNRQYVHTPNKDFYYDTKLNRWNYTENSSWQFLEKAREDADTRSVR